MLALVLTRVGVADVQLPAGALAGLEHANRVFAIVGDNISEREVQHHCAVTFVRSEWRGVIYDSMDPSLCWEAVEGIAHVLMKAWKGSQKLPLSCGDVQQQRDANGGLHAALATACGRAGLDPCIVSAEDGVQLRKALCISLGTQESKRLTEWISGWYTNHHIPHDDSAQEASRQGDVLMDLNAEEFLATVLGEQDSDGSDNGAASAEPDAVESSTIVCSSSNDHSVQRTAECDNPFSCGIIMRNDPPGVEKTKVVRRVIPNAIFLYHLPQRTTEKEVADIFHQYGNIVSVAFKRNSCATVEYDCRRGATRALRAAEVLSFKIRGKVISCRESTTRAPAKKLVRPEPRVGDSEDREGSGTSDSDNPGNADSDDSLADKDGGIEQWAQEWGVDGVVTLKGDGYAEAVRHRLTHDRRLRSTVKLEATGQFIGTVLDTKPKGALRIAQLNGVGGCGMWDAVKYGKMCGSYLKTWHVQFACIAEAGYLVRESHKQRFQQGLQEFGFTAFVWGRSPAPAGKGVALIYESQMPLGKVRKDKNGRAVAISVRVLSGKTPVGLRFICVYCPTGGTILASSRGIAFRRAESDVADFVEANVDDALEKEEVVVAMGDFNAVDDECLDNMGTAAVARDESVLRRALALGLIDTFRVLHPYCPAATRDTMDGGNRLDYILLSPNKALLPCGAAIHVDADFASDHKPVVLDLLGATVAVAPRVQQVGQLKWQRFLDKGCEAEAARDDGDKLQEFLAEVKEKCPVLEEELGKIEEAAMRRTADGIRSQEVREHLGGMVMRVQQAVTETIRRICGRTTGRGGKSQQSLTSVWYGVLIAAKIMKTAIRWTDLNAWLDGRVEMFKQKDEALRKAYSLACAAQEQEDGDFREIALPRIHECLGNRDVWLLEYQSKLFGKQDSIRAQAQRYRAAGLTTIVQTARDERRNLLHRGKLHQFLRRMDPKCRSSTGFKPDFYHNEDGSLRYPESVEEWLTAADQAHGPIMAADCKWLCPRYMRTWEDEVGCLRGELVDTELLTEQERIYRTAFFNPRAAEIDLSRLSVPLSSEESASVFHRMAGKQPGLSKFKIAAARFFPDKMKRAILALINAQIVLALIPSENKHVVVVHIEKAAGGTRPLSLFEEMTKVVEGVVAARIDTVTLGAGPGAVLSSSNHAYQCGRGTYQPLTIDAVIREDARAHKKPLVRIQGDYDSWFDVVVRPVADADMGAK